ncbi:MAG: hypothetical protein F6K40_10415 [Okeania sp. SIO3I5]|uniref:hypothetical protein n=1 Tax=Okeania sp. SIO3I5 TaxID=2607805 RepID=UPI0013B858FE|nr:hypothetical protein [Okeania sp. SIO3I5]NEQ36666.1 hypothetical protein [Okeania sp. SIO3I5]
MPKIKILQEGQSYTFQSYFELPYEADEILAELNYSLVKSRLSLPKTTKTLECLSEIQNKLKNILPFVSLSNETARREILVSPILLEIVLYCHCQLRIEYPLKVNDWLKGNLDYLLRSQNNLLVIQAKNDDLTRGFTQLAVELIALAEVEENKIFYGAVTMGDVWRFGKLNKAEKQITQDINLFKIPDDIKDLGAVLVGILEGVDH